MLFTSRYPDIDCPTKLTVWQWAFEDAKASAILNVPSSQVGGFTDASTRERLSFLQVKQHATHLCTALIKRYGFKETDTVSIFSHNTIWYPVAMFAVLRGGGRFNGASPAYSMDEMTHALRTAGSKYIVTVPGSIKVVLAAAKQVGILKERIFLLEGEFEDFTTMAQLLQIGKSYGDDSQSPCYSVPEGDTNDFCGFLNFSSGTTGMPKAVMISHKNAIAQCLQLKVVAGSSKKRYLACLPLFHISGLIRFLNWPVASNDECIMLPQFTMEAFLQAIVYHQITDLSLVPSIIQRLIYDPIVNKYDLRCLKNIACGAAPLGQEVVDQLAKKMPWTGFRQSYGMTETSCCLTTHPPDFYDYKYGNNGGMLLSSTVIKVKDLTTGKELGPNEVGEILAKGPQIAMGYLSNPKETAETFGADGFLHTGDVGKIDDEGFIHIVDRIKEMIKVKGQQVAPAELEHLLMSHPDVEDCAVIGIPDEYSAERPKAYVVLRRGLQPSDALGKNLIEYVKGRRVRYKWVREIEFLHEIPKSPSSKILRRVLREKEKSGKKEFCVIDVVATSRL